MDFAQPGLRPGLESDALLGAQHDVAALGLGVRHLEHGHFEAGGAFLETAFEADIDQDAALETLLEEDLDGPHAVLVVDVIVGQLR